MFVNRTQITFIKKPIQIIAWPFIVLAAYTKAFGAVATGSINAYEHEITVVITEIENRYKLVIRQDNRITCHIDEVSYQNWFCFDSERQ